VADEGVAVQFGSQGGSLINTVVWEERAGKVFAKVDEFFGQFNIFDILGFSFVIFLGILIIYLAIALRKKIVLMILLLLIGIGVLSGGPFLMDKLIDSIVKKTSITNLNLKQLQFTDALVVTGSLNNLGKVAFKKCKIVVTTRKTSTNKYKDMLLDYKKPANSYTLNLDGGIEMKANKDFKFIVNGFRTDATMKTEVKGICD
jgi:hypothetical protein